ncbi:MAG: hypothetical protein K0R29_288 [Pseudobdellovibrio sp.]|jgi:GT2 family glycosyltransferase|nr:hypothetical protein [Pseudobdellovibrio sp.]
MIKVIIYCENSESFSRQRSLITHEGFKDAEIIFGDSTLKTREQLINENLNSWILFLDHDCVPTAAAIKEIRKVTAKEFPGPSVYAGLYENPLNATALQETHNAIANTWLEQSYVDPLGEAVVLGGIFLIFASVSVQTPPQKFWGAEDKLLAKHLKDAGYKLQLLKDMKAVHDTSKSFIHFVRRAILHGRNDAIYFADEGGSKASYWIQKTDFSDLRLTPLILLHFCIQKGAKAAQKVLRKSKQ